MNTHSMPLPALTTNWNEGILHISLLHRVLDYFILNYYILHTLFSESLDSAFRNQDNTRPLLAQRRN